MSARYDEWRNLVDEKRVKILSDSDAGDVYLDEHEAVTYATPGASGVINVYLPSVRRVPIGACFTVVAFGAVNNVVVKQLATNDGIIALGDQTITIDEGYVIVQNAGGFWSPIKAVLA